MADIKTKLKMSCSNYSDNIDRMWLVAKEIAGSKDAIESMNEVIPKLNATDAYVLGAIHGEMMKDGTIHIYNGKMLSTHRDNNERRRDI
jgi:hypothetical protein